MSMSILKVKNPTTGEWEEMAAIVGPTGPAGPQGIQGEKGDKGDTGPAGTNAYEYAQEGGYTGTEEEFANKLAKDNILYVDFTDNGDGTYQASKNIVEVQDAHAAEIDIKARITYDDMPLIIPIFLIGETFVGYGGSSNNMTIYILHQGASARVTVKELALQDDMNSIADAVNEIDLLLGNNVPFIDNATIGQVLSVASVDGNNAPSSWQAVDLPSGGGDTLEFIKTIKLTEEVSTIKINTDADGNPLNLKRIVVAVQTIGGTLNENKSNYWVHPTSINAGAIRTTVTHGVYATGAAVSSVIDIQMITNGVYLLSHSCNGNPKQDWGGYGAETSIKEINFGVSTENYTFGVNTVFHVMGVKA